MKRFNLNLPEEEFAKLEKLADQKGVTSTELIRQAIRLRIRVETEALYIEKDNGLFYEILMI